MRIRKQKTLLEKAQDMAQDVAEQVRPQVEHALETAKQSAQEARVQAAPYISQGKIVAADRAHLAAEKAQVAAGKASVVASAAAAKAAESAAGHAGNAKHFASEKAATLKGEQPKKGGKLKKLLLVGLLSAVGGAVFAKLRGKQDDAWQSSYVPTPPPPPPSAPSTPAAAAATGGIAADAEERMADDAGGATPGEALADAAEHPHRASNPDAPADVIDIDDVPGNDSQR